MSFDPMPEWTLSVLFPERGKFACPACNKSPTPKHFAAVTTALFFCGAYQARHIPPTLIFTCDNPDCPRCDKDFEYSLSVAVTATAN